MSVSSMMTAIADQIRAIMGASGAMGLEAMGTSLSAVQSDLTSAFTAVGDKGGTVPEAQISGNLASAIGTIPTGVTVQRKTGTLKLSNGVTTSVDCGFQPDVVYIQGGLDSSGKYGFSASIDFAAETRDKLCSLAMWGDTPLGYATIDMTARRTSTGFSIETNFYDWAWNELSLSNKSFSYSAVKYTE